MTGIFCPYFSSNGLIAARTSGRRISREIFFRLLELFGRESEMTSGQRALEDEGVGRPRVPLVPRPKDDFGRPARADDRNEIDRVVADHLGELEGKGGAGDDELGSFPGRGPDEVPGVAEDAQDIDRDRPLGHALRPADLLDQAFPADPLEIGLRGFDVAQADGGEGPDAAFVRHGGGETGLGHADAHSALDDGQRDGDLADGQGGDLHGLFLYLRAARQALPPPKPNELLRTASISIDSAPCTT